MQPLKIGKCPGGEERPGLSVQKILIILPFPLYKDIACRYIPHTRLVRGVVAPLMFKIQPKVRMFQMCRSYYITPPRAGLFSLARRFADGAM